MKNLIETWAVIYESQERNDNFKNRDSSSNGGKYKVERISDVGRIDELLTEVLSMIRNSYKDGYKGVTDIARLKRTTPMLKVVRDEGGTIIACSIYRSVNGSYKMTGAGQNKTNEGKEALQEIVKDDITPYTDWFWVEVSGPMEHYFRKHNGYPIPNEYAVMVLEKPSEKIELLDDGFHYRRTIGNVGKDETREPVTKVIFGFRDENLAKEVLSKTDYAIRREFFNWEVMESNGGEPKDFHRAVSFVNQLSDLYDEEGFRELTPGLSGELDASIDVLEKYRDFKPWVSDALKNAESLRELMDEIKFI